MLDSFRFEAYFEYELKAMIDPRIQSTYDRVRNRWTGCNWPTQFGPWKLNLWGLVARQARLIANATAGQESMCWREAAKWLDQVESDARTAEESARQALHACGAGELDRALKLAAKACNLEANYRPPEVWNQLYQAIGYCLHSVDAN